MLGIFGFVYLGVQLKWPFIRYFVPNRFNRGDPDQYYDDDINCRGAEIRIDFRGRAPLTRSSSPNSNSGRSPNPQVECRLVSLPSELRLHIWKEVLGGDAVHLYHSTKILGQGPFYLMGGICVNPSSCAGEGPNCGHRHALPQKHNGRKWVSLLRTCKKIHIEPIDVLYAYNHFIWSSEVAETLSSTLLPQRVNAMESVKMYWARRPMSIRYPLGPLDIQTRGPERGRQNAIDRRWARWATIWHNVSKMESLRYLDFRFFVEDVYWQRLSSASAGEVLSPLRAVTGLDTFKLTIHWPERIEDEDMEDPWAGSFEPQDSNPWVGLPCEVLKVPSVKDVL